ncbi:MAG: pyruvate, phosphate dikinase [Pyrinomonadaceae bacterium]|nr:pyruvate, phosphate dikinase [Pyrinomonadaceae bacterium]
MKFNKFILISLSLILLSSTCILGQMTRKPTATREPKGVMNKTPDSEKKYLLKVNSREDFDLMARVYHKGTPYAMPHAMFVIDRKEKNKIYYINSQKYRFHKDFLRGNYLLLKGQDVFDDLYIKQNRRFIVGTIAYQIPVEKFTFEYWEGDMIPADQIQLTNDVINKTFFTDVAFKPNSSRHDELSMDLVINRVTSAEISRNQEYLALNVAKGVGRVHIIDDINDETVEIGYNEILVLKEVPISLPPVAGIIVAKQSTPLSHVNLLAKGWGIPNAYIKDADKLFKEFDGRWIEFETTLTEPKYKLAGKEELDWYAERQKELDKIIKSPPSDLAVKRLGTLWQIRKDDSKVYGAKAANLGEITSARIPRVIVPRGFAIPFFYYDEFMKRNGFKEKIEDLQYDNDFVHNPKIRKQKLKAFREEIQNGKFDPKLRTAVLAKWRTYLGGRGVFVRSSSNAEDMPNFSGAGLYETVPNVKRADRVIEAVKTVWASLWNFEAYEARERNFIAHNGTYMGVLMQTGVNMDSSGVLITKDPFDQQNERAMYISAKRGLGIKVVDGKKIAEQILFNKRSNTIQVLTRSAEDSLLVFDENGGVKEVPIVGERNVLTDLVTRRLVAAGERIKRVFGNEVDQDIEWGYRRGRIYILQSRPFIEN